MLTRATECWLGKSADGAMKSVIPGHRTAGHGVTQHDTSGLSPSEDLTHWLS